MASLRRLDWTFFLPKKSDFFPGPSFESWQSYFPALLDTRRRFNDRLFARSSDFHETHRVKMHSNHEMKRSLNWRDLTWFGIGGIMGAGIFVLTGQEAHVDAGPSVILSYVAAGISAVLSVFCYTEFAVEIPVAVIGHQLGEGGVDRRVGTLNQFKKAATFRNNIVPLLIPTSYITPAGAVRFTRQ